MAKTGLILRQVPTSLVSQARPDPERVGMEETDGVCSLDRWQPDWVLVSPTLRRIAIVDLCRPSDMYPGQLLAAGNRKQQVYSPLLYALEHYSSQGWVIHVFPWVVGIRGLIDPEPICALLKFLDIPRVHWQLVIDRTVLASVQALHFLHQVRFGGSPGTMGSMQDPETSDMEAVLEAATLQSLRKRRRTTTLNPNGRDSPDLRRGERLRPRTRTTRTSSPNVASDTSLNAIPAGISPAVPTGLNSGPTSTDSAPLPEQQDAVNTLLAKALPTVSPARRTKRGRDAGAQELADEGYADSDITGVSQHGSNRKRRKRHKVSSASSVFDTDDPAGRRATWKRRSRDIDDQADRLWSKWRQLDACRR